jgi:hypothetical protein
MRQISNFSGARKGSVRQWLTVNNNPWTDSPISQESQQGSLDLVDFLHIHTAVLRARGRASC